MKLLSTKIFLGYLLIIILLTALILYFSFETIRGHYLQSEYANLKEINILVASKSRHLVLEGRTAELDSVIKSVGDRISTRITIIDTDGIVLADSDKNPATMENHRTRPEVLEALRHDVGRSVRFSTTVKDRMLYLAMPLRYNGRTIAITRVSLYMSAVNRLISDLRYEIIKVAVIVVFISMIFVLLFSRTVSRPINLLSRASFKVASGDFDAKIYLRGHDEINELARNFNFMIDKLKELFEKVTAQKEEYNTLISSIQEGLVVLNSEGRIELSNLGFNEIAERENVRGMHFKDLIPEKKLYKVFKKVHKKHNSITKEINIDKKIYLCSGTYIERKNEVVLLLHDITEIKRLEMIKRDFVVNVSHELRTPLTSIKGFVETIEEEADGDMKNYAVIIRRNTDRLINIVQDLLILSELEDTNTPLEISEVDLGRLCANSMKIVEQKARAKNISLKCISEDDLPLIEADNYMLEQLFINLIDNAVKYTDIGEVRVEINLRGDHIYIEFSDTGIGIPHKDIERIFERFYTVDKSRSRKAGGTGLGLSIVKHIVIMHHGEISVDSEKGEGTRFIVKLPLIQPPSRETDEENDTEE